MQLQKIIIMASLIIIFLPLAGCEPSQEDSTVAYKEQPQKIPLPAKHTPPLTGPDCPALLTDANFLDDEYRRVRALNYTVTKQTCDEIIAAVNGRFGTDWMQLRGVVPFASRGEPKVMDAARTFGVTCTEIVLSFACDGTAKLKRDYWPSIVNDYDRDYRRFVADLRMECGIIQENLIYQSQDADSDVQTARF